MAKEKEKISVKVIQLGTITVNEMMTRPVKKIGYGAHILVPRDWLGKKIICILPDSVKLTQDGEIILVRKK